MLRDKIFERCSASFIKLYTKFDNTLDKNGNTILHTACLKDRYDVVYHILTQSNVDVNALNNSHLTPLHLAVYNSNINICSLLLKYGANPNIKDCLGSTPLYIAYNNCKLNSGIISLLLLRGAKFRLENEKKLIKKHGIGIFH